MATKAASPTKSRPAAAVTDGDSASFLAGMVAGILAGERAVLARAITLIESKRAALRAKSAVKRTPAPLAAHWTVPTVPCFPPAAIRRSSPN